MKRICSVIFVILLTIGMVGCGIIEKKESLLDYISSNHAEIAEIEKQEVLLDYINNDCVEISKIENKLLKSYNSVTGDNYASDNETYTEFTANTIELARKLNDKSVEISFKITDEEILEVHRIYMNYSNKFLSTLSLMISALENQDLSQMSEANEKLNEANNLALDYKKELNKLAEKYNVEIQNKVDSF